MARSALNNGVEAEALRKEAIVAAEAGRVEEALQLLDRALERADAFEATGEDEAGADARARARELEVD